MSSVTEFESAEAFNTAKASDVPLVVDFHAAWCGPCKSIGPTYKQWASDPAYKGVMFGGVDVDELGEVAEAEGIEGMPTFKFYHKGKELGQVMGPMEQEITAKLRELSELAKK